MLCCPDDEFTLRTFSCANNMAECLKTYNKSTLERRKVWAHTYTHTCTSSPSRSMLCSSNLLSLDLVRTLSPYFSANVLFQHDNDIFPNSTLDMWARERRTCACVEMRLCVYEFVSYWVCWAFAREHMHTLSQPFHFLMLVALLDTWCVNVAARRSSIFVRTLHARRVQCLAIQSHSRCRIDLYPAMNQPNFVLFSYS